MRRFLALSLLTLASLGLIHSTAQAESPAPVVGKALQKAANFTLPDLNNKQVSLSDHEGDVVFMSFWATWCAPCMVEMPHLQRIYDKYKDQGFVLLAISADDARSASRVKPLIKSKGFTFPVLLDKQTKVVNTWNPGKTLPYGVLLNEKHEVIKQKPGYTPGDEVALEAAIKAAVDARNANVPAVVPG